MNKDLSHDLRLFAEHLSARDFRALSSGLGLGAMRAEAQRRRPALPQPGSRSAASSVPAGDAPLAVSVKPLMRVSAAQPSARPVQGGMAPAPALPSPVRSARTQGAPARPAARAAGRRPASSRPLPPPSAGFVRRLAGRSLDLTFVAVTIVATASTFFYVLDGASFTWAHASQWLLARWLKFVGPFEAMAVLVGGFFAYTLLFRLVAGVTLGELCTGQGKNHIATRDKR